MTRLATWLCCAAALAVVAACGGGDEEVPDGAVATVGDVSIPRASFDKWARFELIESAGLSPVPYDPPEFERCRRARARTMPGTPPNVIAERCKVEFSAAKVDVMRILLMDEWTRQEARKRGIKVSDAEVKRALERDRREDYPNAKEFRALLRLTGVTMADLLERTRTRLLRERLRDAVGDVVEISDADVRSYYAEHQGSLGTPERRDVRVVVTTREKDAAAAKRALDGGESWKAVVRRYSVDATTKRRAGLLQGVAEGEEEPALDRAIFGSDQGAVSGPIETQLGWYVLEVEDVEPATPRPSLAEARPAIVRALKARARRKAIRELDQEFFETYRAETHCAETYTVPECANGSEEDAEVGTLPEQGPEPMQGGG